MGGRTLAPGGIFTPLVFNFTRFFWNRSTRKLPATPPPPQQRCAFALGLVAVAPPRWVECDLWAPKRQRKAVRMCFFFWGGGVQFPYQTIYHPWENGIFTYMNGWFLMLNVGKYTSPMDDTMEFDIFWGAKNLVHNKFKRIWFTAEDLNFFFWSRRAIPKTRCRYKTGGFNATFLANAKFPDDFSTVHTSLPHTVVFSISRLRTVGNVEILKRESGHWKVKPNHLDAEMSILRWMVKQNENHNETLLVCKLHGLAELAICWCKKYEDLFPSYLATLCFSASDCFFLQLQRTVKHDAVLQGWWNVLPLSRTWSFW